MGEKSETPSTKVNEKAIEADLRLCNGLLLYFLVRPLWIENDTSFREEDITI